MIRPPKECLPPSIPFVTTSGQKFMINSSEYKVVGANAYWLSQLSDGDLDTTFKDIAAAGFTTVRTW